MGYPYVVMAANAALSVRRSGVQAAIKLITNFPIGRVRLEEADLFDSIQVVDIEVESNRWIKTNIIDYVDGDQNVFLDCDLEVRASLAPILDLLDTFDIMARNLPFETSKKFLLDNGAQIKDLSLSEINTGVVLFSKSEGAHEVFRAWHKNFLAMGQWRDQPAFLKALLESRQTRFFPLPPMWNATPFPNVDLAAIKAKPKAIRILHYRDPIYWPEIGRRLSFMHRSAVFDLKQSCSDFFDQAAQYSKLAANYDNPLFASALGRSLLSAAAKLRSGDMNAAVHVFAERKTPVSENSAA